MRRFKLLVVALTLPPILLPTLTEAQWSLTPRVYVEEQYDDNIFLTETNEEDDFIITISPGVNVSYLGRTGQMKLDYEYRRSFYTDFSELDFDGHEGRAEARKDFTPWFNAEIRETFIRSEDPVELTGLTEFERPSIRIGERNRYTRNIVEPGATIRFGENRSLRFGYTNNILRNKAENIADQDENALNALLAFRLNIHNGLEVFYEHTNQEYQEIGPPADTEDSDLAGDEIRGRYTYFFDPRTSGFLQYRYLQRDFDTETDEILDYRVHDIRLGFSRVLYQGATLSAAGGYALRDTEAEDDEAFFGQAELSATYKRLTLSLIGETGVGEDFTSAESLGFNKFWRAGVTARYQLLERLWIEGYFYIERDKYIDLDRKDTFRNVRGSIDYQLLRWFYIAFDYERNERDSNIPLESYLDNRYFVRITLQYDIAEFFR